MNGKKEVGMEVGRSEVKGKKAKRKSQNITATMLYGSLIHFFFPATLIEGRAFTFA